MISPEDKKKVEERIDTFDQLLEEDEYIQQQRALGKEEGFAEGLAEGEARGKAKGEIRAVQQVLVSIVQRRFPSLEGLAQQKAERTQQVAALNEIINLIVTAPDEDSVRWVLGSSSAA